MVASLKTAHGKIVSFINKFSWVGPLVVRLTLGVVFLTTGWGKLQGLDKVAEFFASLHIPAAYANAVFVSSIEFAGGILLLVGLGTRVVALFLIGVMAVALWTAKLPDLHGVVDLANTLEFTYLAAFVWLLVAGAGSASLDHVLVRRRAG